MKIIHFVSHPDNGTVRHVVSTIKPCDHQANAVVVNDARDADSQSWKAHACRKSVECQVWLACQAP